MQLKSYLPQDYNPSSTDVLCGRGTQYFHHSGNVHFRQVISAYLPRYEASSTKLQKSILVVELISALQSNFIRFDYSANLWFVLDDVATRQKIGQTIREIINQRDPKKRVAKAQRRARNREQRKLFIRRGSDSDCSSNADCSIISLLSEDSSAMLEPLALSTRTQSAPIISLDHTNDLAFPVKPALARRTKSAAPSFSHEDAALACEPPTFASVSSREWFNVSSLSIEDSDLSASIDSLFEDNIDSLLA